MYNFFHIFKNWPPFKQNRVHMQPVS